jgi:competence protein ComEC
MLSKRLSVADELSKRPFARPLLLWITGILLQVCFPLQRLSIWLLVPVAAALVSSFFFSRKEAIPRYYTHRMWGALFSCVLLFMAIQATAYAEQHLSDPRKPAGRLQRQAAVVQLRMAQKLNSLRLSKDEKSILATITISYRQTLSRDMRRKFSAAGVAHILAVSGFHVGILYGFLSFLFSCFPRRNLFDRIKIPLILLLLWAFAFVAGLSISTVRATLMSSIYLLGQVFNRRAERYNSLAAAAFLLLVYNPFYLFDIGFELSFLAVLFIFWLMPSFSRWMPVRNPLLAVPWNILLITTAAQIGTMFLCSYYFGTVSTVFLMSNLILSLLATVLIPLALLWMILPDGIAGSGILQWAIEQLTHWFTVSVERFGMAPGASLSLHFDFVTMVCAYVSLCSLMLYVRYRRTQMLIVSLAVVLAILCRLLYMRFIVFP